jgi:hypothetical protein
LDQQVPGQPTLCPQLTESLLKDFKEQWAPVMENLDIAEQVGEISSLGQC